MKSPKLLLASLLITTSACAKDDYTTIFDGKTMDGWHVMQKPETDKMYATSENFFAKDGAIHCYQLKNRKGGLVLSDGKYSDFELIVDFKTVWGCDSGIMLRCNEDGQGIQILNDYLKGGAIGLPFGQGTGAYISRPITLHENDGNIEAVDTYDAVKIDKLVYAIDAAGWNAIWKDGEWNTIKIRCVGEAPMITTWINGTKVMEMDGSTYQGRFLRDESKQNWEAKSAWSSERVQQITGGKGSIAFQVHQGGRWVLGESVQYKNIRIKELD